MISRDPEYDRFGPWILEISEEDPPPPLFLPYLNREEPPLFSIKIPRKIERRIANPGMNLYDYLVSLYEHDLVILQRIGDDVQSETFPYRDVQYLTIGEHLLSGALRLGMSSRIYDLPFNSVSTDVIQRLVDLIRQHYTGTEVQMPSGRNPDLSGEGLSYLFTNMLLKAQSQYPQIAVLAAQAETAVGFQESGLVRKLLLGIISKRLAESLHLSNGRELEINNRGKTYRYTGQNLYGTDTVYVPLTKITSVSWKSDPKNTAVRHLSLQTDGRSISFALHHNNPALPFYARYLSQLNN